MEKSKIVLSSVNYAVGLDVKRYFIGERISASPNFLGNFVDAGKHKMIQLC